MSKKRIDIKENIKIHTPKSEWRCAYCKAKINREKYCVALYDVGVMNNGEIYSSGNGLKIHLSCVKNLFKLIEKAIKNNKELRERIKQEPKEIVLDMLK